MSDISSEVQFWGDQQKRDLPTGQGGSAMNNTDMMPIKYGPCDKCGGTIKPCRCTLLAERDALAEQVAELRAKIKYLEETDERAHKLIDYYADKLKEVEGR